jgi:MFS family permease
MSRLVTAAARSVTTDPKEVDGDRRGLLRWNRFFHTADGVTYWAGINAVSYNTVVPLFVSKLTDSPFLIGLVAVFSQAGWYLPQLLTSGVTERVVYKKPITVRLGFLVERAPALLWPVAALLSLSHPAAALALFLGSFGMHFVGAGIIAPAWQDLIAHSFPPRVRGRFFGLTTFLGTSLGALGGLGAGRILGVYGFPLDFALAFTFAAVCVQISWVFLALTTEPLRLGSPSDNEAGSSNTPHTPQTPKRPVDGPGSLLQTVRDILHSDRPFARFLIVRTLMGLGTMGFGFVAVHTTRAFGAADATVASFTVALLVGEATGNLSAGVLSDRRGHRLPLILGVGSVTAAFALARLAPAVLWFYPVFLLMGYAVGAGRVSAMMIAIEYAPPERTPSYVGITNTLAGFGGLLAPLIGSTLASVSYFMLFSVTAAINLAAWLGLLLVVRDPRRSPA